MLKSGFLRFCDNPEITCCKAERELEQLRAESASLRYQLVESQRREQAAVEDLKLNAACPCRVCKNSKCYRRNGRENCKFEWRGPQEAGEGGQDGD